jgi:nucleolar protein 14
MACDAPTLYVRIFQKMILKTDDDLTKRLKEFAAGRVSSCWPSLGQCIFFQQLVNIFASSDFKHGIVGPALMLLCRCISQCPVNTVQDLACGSLLCCVILNYTELTKELLPEVTIFCTRVFDSLDSEQIVSATWLQSAVKMSASKFAQKANCLSWSIFGKGTKAGSLASVDSSIFALCFFLKMVKCLKQRYSESRDAAFFVDTLNMVTVFFADRPQWSKFLEKSGVEGVTGCGAVEAQRVWPPLQWRRAQKKESISLAPAFDLHYTMKKASVNSDADVEKLKALKRQMKREKKASMRELRKDSAFLATEAYREKTQHKTAMREERAKNFAWLQDEQAVFNQQVRMGRVEMKGGGTNGVKASSKKRSSRK